MSLVTEFLLLLSVLIISFYLLSIKLKSYFLLLNVTILFFAYSFLSNLPVLVKLILLIPFAGVVLLLAIPVLRKKLISQKMLDTSRRNLQSFLDEEQDYVDHQTSGWEAGLFSGNPCWELFGGVAPTKLSVEEQAFVDGPVTEFCGMLPHSASGQLNDDIPIEVFECIQAYKFFGLLVPREYGGLGFSASACSTITMKIASRSIAAAIAVMTPNFIGPARLLAEHGTKQQRDEYLPRIVNGEQVSSFASSGLDHNNYSTDWHADGVVACEEYKGKETLGIKLTWELPCTTVISSATLLGLAFDLHDPEHILANKNHVGITLALIPDAMPGVSMYKSDKVLNIPLAKGLTQGNEVFIPIDWVLGGQTKIGQAEPILMRSLTVYDAVLLPALSAAQAKYMVRNASAFARVRDPFNQAKDDYADTYQWLGRIGGNTFMLDAVRWMSASSIDSDLVSHNTFAVINDQQAARVGKISEDTMKVDGNSRLCTGSFQQASLLANIMPVNARSGIKNKFSNSRKSLLFVVAQSHACYAPQIQAMMDLNEQRSIEQFDHYFWLHARQFCAQLRRSIICGVTNSRFVPLPVKTNVDRHYQQVSRLSANFALIVDYVLLQLTGSLKSKQLEFLSIFDMAAYLFMASATLERYRIDGEKKIARPFVEWAIQECERGFYNGMNEILKNLPNFFSAKILGLVVNPWGRRVNITQDQLHVDIAEALMKDMDMRETITDGIYLSGSPEESAQKLENALQWLIKAAPLEKLVTRAKRLGKIKQYDLEQAVTAAIITDLEAEVIRNAAAARQKLFSTDESSLG